jgi:RNA polymerase sigma-70 factor (ECF subfamily)
VAGSPEDDSDLARRASNGDVDAYAALVTRHQDAAVRLAHLLGGRALDAEDVVQEAFVKAYRNLGTFRPGASFRPWLLRIVANETRNRHRSASRRTRYELTLVADRAAQRAAPTPEAAVLEREGREQLVAALASLPSRLRDVVVCRYLLGLSEAETGDVLALPAGTVKSRLSRGLAQLRGTLTGGHDGP